MAALPAEVAPRRLSLVAKFAERYSIEPEKLLTTLKATCFKVEAGEVSNEQMAALLVVADQYRLNPFTREIYAFPDKNKGIVPIVSIDGWARIINEQASLDGIEFVDGPSADGGAPEWIECVIHRKDRAHPIRVRERMKECKRGTGPWSSHPARMLRHKALIQCSRVAFGFAGIYDQDEAEAIIERDITPVRDDTPPQSRTASMVERARKRQEPQDVAPEPKPVQDAGGAPYPSEEIALLAVDNAQTSEAALEVEYACRGLPFEESVRKAVANRFPE